MNDDITTHIFLNEIEEPLSWGIKQFYFWGNIDDYFFYNYYYGFQSFKDTWSLYLKENKYEVIMFLDSKGNIEFLNESIMRPKYEEAVTCKSIHKDRRGRSGEERPGKMQENPLKDEQTQQTVEEVRSDQKGTILQRTLGKITRLFKNKKFNSSLVIQNMERFIKENNQQIEEIIRFFTEVWLDEEINRRTLLIASGMSENYINTLTNIPSASVTKFYKVIQVGYPRGKDIDKFFKLLQFKYDFKYVSDRSFTDYLENYLKDNKCNLKTNVYTKIVELYERNRKEISMKTFNPLPKIDKTEVERILKELNQFIGLSEVKKWVRELINRQEVDLDMENQDPPTTHLIFAGNPGTGKTEVARLIGPLFYALGIRRKNTVLETSKNDFLSADNADDTAKITEAKIQEAMGGVLFIDEAYAIKDGQFGQSVVDVLVPKMENFRGDLTVILCGYKTEIDELLQMNIGFRGRIPGKNEIKFLDYSLEELLQIFYYMLEKKGYYIDLSSTDFKKQLKKVLAKRSKKKDFGQARGVRNLVDEVINYQKIRIKNTGFTKDKKENRKITTEDIYELVKMRKINEEELKEALCELDTLVGLAPVKQKIKSLITRIKFQLKRESIGVETDESINLNCVFAGSPGTGKTTVAKLMGKIFKVMGLCRTGEVYVNSSDSLTDKHIRGTGPKTEKAIKESLGGILFIDEAYGLAEGSEIDHGKEAVTTLVGAITDDKYADLIVILAGYRSKMDKFFAMNDGLKSRIPNIIDFPDYSAEECVEIFKKLALKKDYILALEVEELLERLFTCEKRKPNFNNGRDVDNWFQKIVDNMGERIDKTSIPSLDDVRTILPVDIVYTFSQEKRITIVNKERIGKNYLKGILKNDLSKNILPSIVQIIVSDKGCPLGVGTGFFISDDGLIATAGHVANEYTDKVVIILNADVNQIFEGIVVTSDASIDIAILKINCENTPCLKLGESEKLKTLSTVISFGFSHTSSSPGEKPRVIEAKITKNQNYDYFETDGAFDAGFSGGPIISVKKDKINVVGILSGSYGTGSIISQRVEILKELIRKVK